MSHELLYGMFGVHGYNLSKMEVDDGVHFLRVQPQPHRIRCSNCGGQEVVRRGSVERLFRSLPIRSQLSFVLVELPRAWCRECGLVRQLRIGLTDARKHYTHA